MIPPGIVVNQHVTIHALRPDELNKSGHRYPPEQHALLRAEIDGLVAHLYGLTEQEFAHILLTFPVVPDPVRESARNAYRAVARGDVI